MNRISGLKGRLFDRNLCFNCEYREYCSRVTDDGYTTSDIKAETIKCPSYNKENNIESTTKNNESNKNNET